MKKEQFSLQHFNERLASYDALPQWLLLGLACGLFSGLLIAAFRAVVDLPLEALLPDNSDNFEALIDQGIWLLPLAGSAVLALLFYLVPKLKQKVGMVHLFERIAYHQSHLTMPSMTSQFISASVALLSGHSVGREGPAVYLGACSASLLGQRLKVPNNSLKILVACGSAAAIAAAFNTPLAGVIFAMEVILLEYSLSGFMPIIVAAVTGNLIVRALFDDQTLFTVPAFDIASIAELPWMVLMGIVIGLCAALFNRLMLLTVSRTKQLSLPLRLLLAGLLTGLVALIYPQVMGIGYDTISAALLGQLGMLLLAGIAIAKLLLTPVILGLGIPAGLIGPSLFIGALIGGWFGQMGDLLAQMTVSHAGLYAMLGMGAMMAAVLNAPLAGLIALLELTGNTNIIWPGMIAIVTSNLTVRYCFKMPSIFIAMLEAQGLNYRQQPLARSLSQCGVVTQMQRQIHQLPIKLTAEQYHLLGDPSGWLYIEHEQQEGTAFLLSSADLKEFIHQHQDEFDAIDLRRIPAERQDVVRLNFRATLLEALESMNEHQVDRLCVTSHTGKVIGLIERQHIENYYQHAPNNL